jgi:hypothetical protein
LEETVNRFIRIAGLAVLLLLINVLGINLYVNRARTVVIAGKHIAGAKLLIYKSLAGANDDSLGELVPITISSDRQLVKLKPGSYVAIIKSSPIYSGFTKSFLVEKKSAPQNLNLSVTYSRQKLDQLLPLESAALRSAILRHYPSLPNRYSIDGLRLYGLGEWASALLKPNHKVSSDQADIYRVVLSRTTSWIVVTSPPEIIISSKKYPTIPKDVLSNLNKQH